MEPSNPARPDSPARPRPKREIIVPDTVRWHDGMPLSPQHFQDSFRRTERLLDSHLGLAAPYHYGVTRLEIDRGRLSAGELHVNVDAVMPDRLLFRTGGRPLTVRLDPAELRKKAEASGRRGLLDLFDVYLAIPWERPGRAAAGELPRYLSTDGDRVSDDTTGGNDIEIQRLVPNARILVDVEPPADSAWIRIAQLRVAGEAFSRAEYVPPALTVSSDTPLYALSARIAERIRNTANRLAERLTVLSENTDRELIAEARRQIYHLTAALPVFEAMLFTEQSHPYPLYLALAGIIGQLAPLSRSPLPPPMPAYQHDDLHATFTEIDARIQRTIREGIQESFRAYAFDLMDGLFKLDSAPGWADRPVVLAVRERRGGAEGDAARWIAGAVIGPARGLRDLVASRALGAKRELVPRMDDLVPTSGEYLFALKNLKDFIKADEPLAIYNPAREAEELRPSELVLYVKKESV